MVGTTLKFGRRYRSLSALCALLILLPTGTPIGRAFASEFRFLTNGGQRSRATPGTLPFESPTRIRIDLDSTWGYSVDGGTATGDVTIPSAYDFSGRVAFQRTFQVPADVVNKYQFHLIALGVNQNAEITLNNDFITNHSGGYTTINQTVPANSVQAAQDNVLRVVVNNVLDYRRGFPLRPLPWMPRDFGGILRDIYLVGTPPTYIAQAAVSTDYDARTAVGRVHIRLRINRSETPATQAENAGAGPLACSAELIDKISGITVGRSNLQGVSPGDTVTTLELTVPNPKPWSPDSPELYLLRCSLSRGAGAEGGPLDEYDVNCGIRRVQVADGSLMLNGGRIVLKGVIWNEDHPAFGNALSFEQMEKDVAQIKALGANTVRFIYHPPHPYMLDLCDRYGLLALEEIPVKSVPAPVLADEGYREAARAMLRELITRDRNHASVIAWGLGDGNDVTLPATREAMEDLAGLARSLDNRLLYAVTAPLAGDICTDLMDIAAVSVRDQDVRDFRARLEAWQAAHPEKAVVVAAFGTQVQHENHRGYTDPLSQEAQARYYLQRLDVVKALDYDGAILESFNDWAGARPSLTVETQNPWEHMTGLVSAWREKRLAFDAVRASFHGEKFAALPLGTYSSKASIYFVLAGFAALVGMAYLYNASRRFRESLNRSLLNAFNFFSDVRDQRLVSPVHTLLLGLGVSAGTAIVMASIAYHFRESWVADNLLTFVLVSDRLKAAVVRLIWHPLTCMAATAAIVFAGFVVLGVAMFAVRVFFRQRTYLAHTLTIAFWSAAPFLVFIPIGMVLYRLLESPAYVVPMLVVVAAIHVWVVLRMLKGLSIVYDVFPPRMYAAGLLVILVVAAGLYLYYDAVLSLPMYARSMYDIATHLM